MNTSNDFDFPERHAHSEAPRGSSDRVFGLVLALFWSMEALAPLRKGAPIRIWAVILAGSFFGCAMFRPTVLGSLNQQWQRLGRWLQKLISPVVMALLYFSTVVPVGLIMQLLKRDILRLKWSSTADTYWIPHGRSGPPPESMKDQF